MSFGLSVGDIVTTISITQHLLQLDELQVLGQDNPIDILRHLKALLIKFRDVRPRNNNASQVQYLALMEVSSQCQIALEHFRDSGRLNSRNDSTSWSIANRTADEISTIWSPKVLVAFRAEITGHLLSLIMLDNLNNDSAPRTKFQSLATLDRFTLRNVQEMTAPVAQSIRAFDKQNTLIDRTMRIISTNLRIYNAIVDLQQQRSVPTQVELQQPVILHDALDRRTPFHLEYVTSHKTLNEVLALRFNNDDALQGYVRSGDFVLWSRRTRGVIDFNKRWESCFRPGDVVDMSIALQPSKRCLVCGSKVSIEANERVACQSCLTNYRRRSSQSQDKLIGPPTAREAFDTPAPRESDVLASPSLQEFIIQFLSNEFTKFPEFSIWGPTSVKKWDLTQFYSKFSELIQELGAELFALATDEFQRQIARTVRRRHLAITKQVKNLSIARPTPVTDSLQRRESFQDFPAPTDGRRRSVISINGGSAIGLPNSKRLRPKGFAPVASTSSESRDQPSADEASAVLFLTAGNALANLGQRIRKSLYFDSDPHAKFWLVDQKMMEGFQTLNSFRNPAPNERYTTTFKVFWQLWQFLQDELDGSRDLSPVMTLSGSAVYARASQCGVYLQENWGQLGLDLMGALETALKAQTLQTDGTLNLSVMDISIELHTSRSPDDKEYALIRVEGSMETLKQTGHCLTWLTAAIRISEYDQMSYSDAILTDHTYLAPFSTKPELQNSMYFEIYSQDLQPLSKEEQEMCWNPLFPHSVIADGFPIPKRDNIPGLEISFDIMTNLSGVSYPVDHAGGLVLQGLSTMLVPTRLESDDSLQWHFMAKPKGSRMTLKDVDENCEDRYKVKDLSSLQTRRAFLGWSKEANIYLGTKEMNYARMGFSRAIAPAPRMELSGFSVGLGTSIMGQGGPTAVANFTIGKRRRNEFSQQREQDLEFELRKAANVPVLLYDPNERRGWLVSTLSVILHLAHIYANIWPEQVTYKNKRVQLPYAEPSSDGGAAALKAILDNHASIISESSVTKQPKLFLDLIREIYFALMIIVDRDSLRPPPSRSSIMRRPLLSGWELMGIVASPNFPRDKEHALLESSGGWFDFSSDVLVLFCDGLGEVIRPIPGRNFLCERWRGVPTGKDYLAASVGMLMVLSQRCGYGDSCKMVAHGAVWERGEDGSELFEDCRHLVQRGRKCYAPLQRIRKVKSGRMFSRSRDREGQRGRSRAGSRSGMGANVNEVEAGRGRANPGGAVIFGKKSRGIPTVKVKVTISRGGSDEDEGELVRRERWGLRSPSEVGNERIVTRRNGEYSPGVAGFDSGTESDEDGITTPRADGGRGGALIRVLESDSGLGDSNQAREDPPPDYEPGEMGRRAIGDGLLDEKGRRNIDGIMINGIRVETYWIVGAAIFYLVFVGVMNKGNWSEFWMTGNVGKWSER